MVPKVWIRNRTFAGSLNNQVIKKALTNRVCISTNSFPIIRFYLTNIAQTHSQQLLRKSHIIYKKCK
jgi:hypothetical protein